jgi:steroid delta-isomerase-like uncharacterized protein
MKSNSHYTTAFFTIALFFMCFSFSCQQKAKEAFTEHEAKAFLDRYMETMNKADMQLVDEIISPDFVLRTPFLPEPLVGIEGYKGLVTNTANTFSDFNAIIEDVLVRGDELWGKFSMEGVNTGPLGDLPATGKKFSITGLAITRVVDGKVVEDETFWDVLGFYQQLGFTLTPPQQLSEK